MSGKTTAISGLSVVEVRSSRMVVGGLVLARRLGGSANRLAVFGRS